MPAFFEINANTDSVMRTIKFEQWSLLKSIKIIKMLYELKISLLPEWQQVFSWVKSMNQYP